MKLISACLLGVRCRYDGCSKPSKKAIAICKKQKGEFIPVCPEQLGGFPTPRTPSEIQQASGEEVLVGTAKILNKKGEDVSENFVKGAKETLKIAKMFGATEFIGKYKSPSCGYGKIHDGSFTGILKDGDGVCVALLKKNGIKVITEQDL